MLQVTPHSCAPSSARLHAASDVQHGDRKAYVVTTLAATLNAVLAIQAQSWGDEDIVEALNFLDDALKAGIQVLPASPRFCPL
jgi:hypothetical protein